MKLAIYTKLCCVGGFSCERWKTAAELSAGDGAVAQICTKVQAGMVAPQTEHPLMVGTVSVKKLGFMTTFC